MKTLHTFEIEKEKKIKVDEKRVEDGKEITVSSETVKKVPIKFYIKKPTRSLLDDGDLYYSIKLSEGIKEGLLTRAMLSKRFVNDGGVLTNQEREDYIKLYSSLFEKENEFQRLHLIAEKDRTEEDKKKIESLISEISTIQKDFRNLQTSEAALFEHTAETRAKNKTIIWWCLHLAYVDEDAKTGEENKDKEPILVFGDGDMNVKTQKYYDLADSEQEFYQELFNKLSFYVTAWYMGSASKPEDFVNIEKDLE